MTTSVVKPVGLAVCCALFGAACSRDTGPAANASPVLASGAGIVVTEDEFLAKLREQPAPGDFGTLEKKRALLDQLIEHKALVAEAKRLGLDRDPEIVQAHELMLVQRLLRDRQASQNAAPAPTDAELQARYEAEKSQSARPELVRVGHLFLKAQAPADRALRQGEARELRAQAAALPADMAADQAFAELARKRSDEAGTAAAGGDLTFRSHDWLEAMYSKEVADAAFALTSPGQVSEVVESSRGLHVLRFIARAPARVPSFEEFRASLSVQWTRESRDEELRAYGRKLRDGAKVVVREAELSKLDPGKPAPHP